MTIRLARKGDAWRATPLILAAMGNAALAETGSVTREQAEETVLYLFSLGGNHLSYQNALAYETEQEIAGLAIYYDGSEELQLFASAAKQIRRLRPDSTLMLSREAKDDELCISILSVNPHFARRGIGSALLKAVEEEGHRILAPKLSLNVSIENEAALRLYKRLGYVIVGKLQIDKYPYYHMVKELAPVLASNAASELTQVASSLRTRGSAVDSSATAPRSPKRQ